MNARFFFSLIFFHFSIVVFSQTFCMKGTVVSSDTQTPLEFANVTLSDRDGKILQGTITDSLGRFYLIVDSHVQPIGKNLTVSYLGYESLRQPVDKEDIGVISLNPSVKALQKVVVAGRRSPFTMKGGTFTTNIQKSILKDAGNAMDVLKQLPLINIKNDIVNIFGKGEALIYIDNKELHSNEDLLKLSSKKIKKIDIITTPGVQYSASVGAVIKITTTTPDEGFSGLINTKVQRGEDWSEMFLTNLSYTKNGFSFFTDYSMQDLRMKQNQQTDVEINGLSHNLIYSNNKLNLSRRTHNLGIAAEYKASDKHLFGIRYNHSFLADGYYNIFGETTAYIGSKKDAEYSQISHYTPNGNGGNMNMFYKGKISKWSVDFNADYMYGQTKTLASYDNTEHVNSIRNIVNSNSKNDYRLSALRLELSRVIGNSSVLFGADYAKTRNNSYYNNDDRDLKNDLPETYTINKQDLFSLFLNYKCNAYDFDIEMGLRYEFVNQLYYINSVKKADQSKTYSNFSPTFIISHSFFNEKMNMALSYRRVVNRPSYYQLRSDVQYNSPYSYEAGNPLLQNTYIDDISYTVSYLDLNLIASYKLYHDKILFTIDQFEDKAITFSRFTNMDGFKKFSIASVWDPTFFKIWNPEIEVGFEKQFFKLNNGNAVKSYNRPYLYVSLYNIIRFPHTISFVTQAKYWTSYNSGISCEYSGMFVDAYIQKYFFDKTMVLKIGAENIFNTNKDKWEMAFNTVNYKKNANNDSRFIYISFIYNFHNAKKYTGKGTRNSERNRLNTL